jgi:3-oxoacyl-[acyl-carrier protein] reductase
MNRIDLEGRKAVVTGGARGIGLAIAERLMKSGAEVSLWDLDAPALDASVKHLAPTGKAHKTVVDVTDVKALTAASNAAIGQMGKVDILINNAGIAVVRGVDDLTEADFDQTIAVNLKSVFLCTQAVLPAMRAKKWGRIVNISSGAARGAGSIGPHYNASKAGMEGLTRGYAARLVKDGITVNAVAPSLIETDMMKGQQNLVSRIPLGRFGTADEVAKAVMLLIDNPYMTGQTIAMSGGMAFN